MNNELKMSIDEFISKIKNSGIYLNYINILDQVNNSNEIIDLTTEIKKIEKSLVLTPSVELENKLNDLNEMLNNIPLYLDYKDALDELNNLLICVKNKFDLFIEDISL